MNKENQNGQEAQLFPNIPPSEDTKEKTPLSLPSSISNLPNDKSVKTKKTQIITKKKSRKGVIAPKSLGFAKTSLDGSSHLQIIKSPLNEKKSLVGSKSKFSEPILQKSLAPLNMMKQIKALIKIGHILKSRTKFRDLRQIKPRQIGLINDASYYIPNQKHQRLMFLKRFTSKNTLLKIYYYFMNCLFANCLIYKITGLIHNFLKFLDEKIPVIKPFQKGKVLWDLFILTIIVHFFFVIPMQISFDFLYENELEEVLEHYSVNHGLSQFLLFFPEMCIIIDSLLKLVTGYYENGLVITEKEHIISHYLKNGLIFDILSYCPIVAQSFLHEAGTMLKITQLLVFCKSKRIQIIMNNFKEMISLKGEHDYILSLIILTFELVFFSHINACLWHLVAYYYPSGHGITTWLDYSQTRSLNWPTRYYYSLYWSVSIMVTIGFGEKVSPQNNAELIVGVAIFLSSALFFGYTINAMREIFDEIAKGEKEYKECLSIINHFMKKRNLHFELQGRVRKYLEYMMHKERNLEKEREILNKLTSALRREVILESNGKYLKNIDLFQKNFSSFTLQNLAFVLKECKFSPEEFIYKKGDLDDCSLYIIDKGELEVTLDSRNFPKTIKVLKSGEIFGSKSFFTDDPREHSIRSRNFSTILEVKKADFLNVIKSNKDDYEKYVMMKDQIKLYNNYQILDLSCFSCDKTVHQHDKCPITHFVPDASFIIKRHLYSSQQPRNTQFKRKSKQKFNALFRNSSVLSKIFMLDSSLFMDEESPELSDYESHKMGGTYKDFDLSQILEKDEFGKGNGLQSPENEYSENIILSPQQKSKESVTYKQEFVEALKESPEKDETEKIFENLKEKHNIEEKSSSNLDTQFRPQRAEKFKRKTLRIPTMQAVKMQSKKKKSIGSLEIMEKDLHFGAKEKEVVGEGMMKNQMFQYDFESGKEWSVYCIEGNYKWIIEKLNIRNLQSTNSIGSKAKKKKERRARLSRFQLDIFNKNKVEK